MDSVTFEVIQNLLIIAGCLLTVYVLMFIFDSFVQFSSKAFNNRKGKL